MVIFNSYVKLPEGISYIISYYIYKYMFAGWKGADKKPIQQPDWSLLELLEKKNLRDLGPRV